MRDVSQVSSVKTSAPARSADRGCGQVCGTAVRTPGRRRDPRRAPIRKHQERVVSSNTGTAGTPRVTDQPAWTALAQHHREVSGLHLRELFARIPAAANGSRSRPPASISTTRRTESPTRRWRCSSGSPRSCGLRERIDAMFRGEHDQRHGEARRPARGAARAARRDRSSVDGQNVVPDVHAVLDRMAEFCGSRACRAVERPHRASRSATSSTSASAAPTSDR